MFLAVPVWAALVLGIAGCAGEPAPTEPLLYDEPKVPAIRMTSLESRLSSVRLAVHLDRPADRGAADERVWGALSDWSSGPRSLFSGPGQPILLKPESGGWTKWFEEWARTVVIAADRSVSQDPSDPLLEVFVRDLWLDTSPERCRAFLKVEAVEAEEWKWQDDGSVSCWVNPHGDAGGNSASLKRTYRGYGEAQMRSAKILGQRLRDWLQKTYVDRETEPESDE